MKKDLLGLLSKKYDEIIIKEDCCLTELEKGGDIIRFSAPVKVEGTLSRLEENVVYFSGNLETVADANCGRCLEPVQEAISIEFGEVVYADGKEEEYDLIAEPEGDVFDVEAFVKNILELKLPMRFLCHGECKGLCPVCGTNLNTSECNCKEDQIDERFAKLKDLLEDR